MSRRLLIVVGSGIAVVALSAIALLLHSQPKTQGDVSIGCILDLSGPVAPYGQWSKNGIDLALEDLQRNDWGRNLKLRLVVEDGRSSPKDAVSAFKKLVAIDKAKVVVITTGSSSVLSVAPIAEENHVILFTPAASAPEITNAGDYVFRNRVSGLYEVQELAGAAYKTFGVRRASALIVNNDFGQSYKKVFVDQFESLGGQIVSVETFEQGATDLRAQLTKLKQAQPQAVYLVGYAVECGYALKQAREIAFTTRWLSTLGIEAPNVLEIAGVAADGVIYTSPRYLVSDPATKSFDEAYRRKYGEASNMYAANSYDALMMLARIIAQRGYDADAIKDGLYSITEYPGVSGITSFDKHGDAIKPLMLKIIKDGKFDIYHAE